MNTDLRSSLDLLNTITAQHRIVLHEEDFVDGETELTDNQIKQLFMILGQGAVYKKIQGSLKGYKPPFKLDKVGDEDIKPHIAADDVSSVAEELNEASLFSKMKDAFVDKFGSKGQKMAMVARNTSSNVWDKWESESIAGGIPSTVETVGRWIKNKGVDSELIDLAFTSIGVPNINNTIGIEEPEAEPSVIQQWLDDEMLMATAFTGALAKDFLLDKGVPEDRADKMLTRIGVTSGKIVSKEQYGKLEAVAQRFGGTQFSVSTDGETPTTDWSAAKVRDYILNKYEIEPERLDAAFSDLGVDLSSDTPIGDNVLRKLTNAIVDQVPEKSPSSGGTETKQKPEAVMDRTQKIMRELGGSVGKSVQAGKKAVAMDDFTNMTELQKLGVAILTARKKL